MKICVIGWYGTETLGDRAILDGLFRIFAQTFNEFEIAIGSLFPFLTERTILEDNELYRQYCPEIVVNCFDVRNKTILLNEIDSSDFVVVGGGPIMDLCELYIIEYALRNAKKKKKFTALLGCGYGPLKEKEFINLFKNILKSSDLTVLRSRRDMDLTLKLLDTQQKPTIFSSMDPAALSVFGYLEQNGKRSISDSWLMNIRDLGYVYNNDTSSFETVKESVKIFANQVSHLELVPMHTFSIGGDDRLIQNLVSQELQMRNIKVQQKPLCLKEMYEKITNAVGCIGMRYHSVLFQTFLNGNNYIVDYTSRTNGKICNFIEDIDSNQFYKDRYLHIEEIKHGKNLKILSDNLRFQYDDKIGQESMEEYKKLILSVME